MSGTIPIVNLITDNSTWIAIILVASFIVAKLWMYFNRNKKDILKRVENIQNKHKLPKQRK